MTPEEWQRIKAHLAEALAIEPDARAAYLATLPASEREQVESLLAASDDAPELLETPVGPARGIEPESPAAPDWTGRRVGAYRLTGTLGEGGMGTVFRAVRDDGAFDREVAVKIIRGGVAGDVFLDRFRNERQILARLDHPNIARLLDGGTAEDGVPFLVMELVAGEPIDQYCRRHALSVEARLRLFRGVCSAVQYAHQNLIVHRDLKPSNILVTAEGVPKLLDFGIAKVLAADAEQRAERTMYPIMTLDFASPEQLRNGLITTASDVYSASPSVQSRKCRFGRCGATAHGPGAACMIALQIAGGSDHARMADSVPWLAQAAVRRVRV